VLRCGADAGINVVSVELASSGAAHQEQNRPPGLSREQEGHLMVAGIDSDHFGNAREILQVTPLTCAYLFGVH
jgi:hypothetical protein